MSNQTDDVGRVALLAAAFHDDCTRMFTSMIERGWELLVEREHLTKEEIDIIKQIFGHYEFRWEHK